MRDDHLATYLNDHRAGAVAAVELIERCRDANAGSPLGVFLDELRSEVEADKQTLEQLIDALDLGRNRVKGTVAWLGEKLGRAKLNDRLSSYSDLSRLEELEALLLGVRGKEALWEALEAVQRGTPALEALDFEALAARAREQGERLEAFRRDAARRALG